MVFCVPPPQNPKGFLEKYDAMLRYTLRQETWPTTQKELEGRGVGVVLLFSRDSSLAFVVKTRQSWRETLAKVLCADITGSVPGVKEALLLSQEGLPAIICTQIRKQISKKSHLKGKYLGWWMVCWAYLSVMHSAT